jgi:predicted small lipoprotein YifL
MRMQRKRAGSTVRAGAGARTALAVATAAALLALAGCGGGGPAPLSQAEVMERLEDAGFQVEILDEPAVAQDDRSQFVAEPVGILAVRLSDGRGNSEAMTLVQFPQVKDAEGLDARPVNGFAARNWFFLGIIANHFRDPIQAAMS